MYWKETVNPSQYLLKYHAVKHMDGGGVHPHNLYLNTVKCQRTASRSVDFMPEERRSGTNCVGGWVGRWVGVNVLEKKQISHPCRESMHDASVIYPFSYSLYRLSYPIRSLLLITVNY